MLSIEDVKKSTLPTSDLFNQISHYDHEQVAFCNDNATGLKAIIAIHDTTLGPALGGTRFWNYKSEAEAIYDVLRLSRGMTYKAAITGINLGGGKAVIIGDPTKLKSEFFWRRYGKFINSLSGKYITAEDVNTGMDDMGYVANETEFVTGKPPYLGGGGDPSPLTAYGTYLGMKACAKKVWGADSLSGKTVWVQGAGHVGSYLVERLAKEGAKVLISDINTQKIATLAAKCKIEVVDSSNPYDVKMDIYAPCALGATLNTETIDKLQCAVVAGAANNQLEDEALHAEMLKDRGILYAPDFLINAGGIINCYVELEGYNEERAYALTENIYDRTLQIINKASRENITTFEAAKIVAQHRIDAVAKLNSKL